MRNKATVQKQEEVASTYTKHQLLMCRRYRERRDILDAILEEKAYSFAEVDGMIEKFMKGTVK